MKLLAQFDLDIFPPSVNHMQRTGSNSNIRYDTAEYKQFKRDFAAMVGNRLEPLKAYEGCPLSLAVYFFWSGWFTKAGQIRKGRDVSNRYKAIEDAVFKAIGIDDAFNYEPKQFKRWSLPNRDRFIECQLFLLQEDALDFLHQGSATQAPQGQKSGEDSQAKRERWRESGFS